MPGLDAVVNVARAQERLRDEEVIWITTVRADGQPQSSPVWFHWDGDDFLVMSQPSAQKLRNIGRDPKVSLHLNSDGVGGDVLIAEAAAQVVAGGPDEARAAAYLAKYDGPIKRLGYTADVFASAYTVALRIAPTRWRSL